MRALGSNDALCTDLQGLNAHKCVKGAQPRPLRPASIRVAVFLKPLAHSKPFYIADRYFTERHQQPILALTVSSREPNI